jgi:hypothetical protein
MKSYILEMHPYNHPLYFANPETSLHIVLPLL